MKSILEKITTDVLIIGSGAAGIRAALAASGEGVQVLLLTEGRPTRHGATFVGPGSGWGFQALLGAERTTRNLERFYNEIIQVGLGCCDPELAGILVEESGSRLEDLITHGLRLQLDSQNRFLRVPGCFSREPRAFLSIDRRNIRLAFRNMLQRSRAKVLSASVLGLLVTEKVCGGAWAVAGSGEVLLVHAKATILASGGGAALFRPHAGPDDQIGLGYALALAAGADLINLEFIQFLLGLKQSRKFSLLPLDRLAGLDLLRRRHADDSLVNPLAHLITGEKIIAQRQSHAPFSGRDDSGLIDLQIARLNQKREKVFWNDSSPSEPLEVLHLAQAFNGGLKINSRAETTLPNLFAAGEVAAGPHGADRIGGCMLTATQVFGARAGQAAALRAKRIKTIPRLARPPELRMLMTQKKILPKNPVAKILFSARKKFSQEVMILRNKPGLSACLSLFATKINEINELEVDPFTKVKTCQALLVMDAVTTAALARTTSLGPHFRTDSNRLDSLPQS